MKREFIFLTRKPEPEKKPTVEEVTVYGTGAGLYSHLNALARTISAPPLDRRPFRLPH